MLDTLLSFGLGLTAFAIGTLAWGITLGVVTEAYTEAYREADPLGWLRAVLSRIPFVKKAQACGECWPMWIATAAGVVVLVWILPGLVLATASTVLAVPIAWRVSQYWHDRIVVQRLEKDLLRREPEDEDN